VFSHQPPHQPTPRADNQDNHEPLTPAEAVVCHNAAIAALTAATWGAVSVAL
jgi:hypothetical protein